MEMTYRGAQTVGDIVAIMPAAGEVFKKYRIDFCCGGNRPLTEVIKEQKLDEDEVIKKLDEAFENDSKGRKITRNFTEMSQGELIEYIEDTHHAYTKKVLPELGELTTKIMRVHGLNHEVLFKVHKLFSALKAELEQHLMKEEELLFPLIGLYDRKPSEQSLQKISQVLNETEAEHEAAGDILKELRKITEDYKVPEDGCNTYRITFRTLEELEGDLFGHIHLENNILFKRLGL